MGVTSTGGVQSIKMDVVLSRTRDAGQWVLGGTKCVLKYASEHIIMTIFLFIVFCTATAVVMDEWNFADVDTVESRNGKDLFPHLKDIAKENTKILEGLIAMERQNNLDANSGVKFNTMRNVARRFSVRMVSDLMDKVYDVLGPTGVVGVILFGLVAVYFLMRLAAIEEVAHRVAEAARKKEV